ncbi:hypothetical protein VNO77_10471 [Canavalia gladiata]|uniref:Uncharacterized protein n=1 Tax=Canavalia gladiata TaxID=3824 RepID=A0AAN9MAY7_CANGL
MFNHDNNDCVSILVETNETKVVQCSIATEHDGGTAVVWGPPNDLATLEQTPHLNLKTTTATPSIAYRLWSSEAKIGAGYDETIFTVLELFDAVGV